jgi:hypothetical protein
MRRPEIFRSRFQYPLWWWNVAIAVAAWVFLVIRNGGATLAVTVCVAIPFVALWWLGILAKLERHIPAVSSGWFWVVVYGALLVGVCVVCTLAVPEATVIVLYAFFLAAVTGIAVIRSAPRK